jgi:asparagine N-glycosylation enzyme membrane subunit Stt3
MNNDPWFLWVKSSFGLRCRPINGKGVMALLIYILAVFIWPIYSGHFDDDAFFIALPISIIFFSLCWFKGKKEWETSAP